MNILTRKRKILVSVAEHMRYHMIAEIDYSDQGFDYDLLVVRTWVGQESNKQNIELAISIPLYTLPHTATDIFHINIFRNAHTSHHNLITSIADAIRESKYYGSIIQSIHIH